MQCFMCITYLMIICSAHPPKDREIYSSQRRRSLFHDVIESLRIKAKLPEVFTDEENHLEQSFEGKGFENERLHLPNDVDFLPRRNDRVEMPMLKYRFPKNLDINNTKDDDDNSKEEIVLYINAPEESETTTPKSKTTPKTKRPRPAIKNKNKTKENIEEQEVNTEQKPGTNMMSGQSQIGNRESQTVIKPTVIVNLRGSVSHRESDIRLESRKNNNTKSDFPLNIFNINQEIKLQRADTSLASTDGARRVPNKVRQAVKISSDGETMIEEDMMMCESNSWKEDDSRNSRQLLQILLSV